MRVDIQAVTEVLESNPDYLQTFSLVIVSNIDPSTERRIAEALWEGEQFGLWVTKRAHMAASSVIEGRDIPLLAIRNSGFVGRLEVQLREHCGEYLI
jgi:amyloid beta precursor protein binding protein 1